MLQTLARMAASVLALEDATVNQSTLVPLALKVYSLIIDGVCDLVGLIIIKIYVVCM